MKNKIKEEKIVRFSPKAKLPIYPKRANNKYLRCVWFCFSFYSLSRIAYIVISFCLPLVPPISRIGRQCIMQILFYGISKSMKKYANCIIFTNNIIKWRKTFIILRYSRMHKSFWPFDFLVQIKVFFLYGKPLEEI